MEALPVIEAFNILKNRLTRFRAILERTMMSEFVLESAEETLDYGIIIATALNDDQVACFRR